MSSESWTECPSCDRELKSETGMKRHHLVQHGESLANKEERECPVCGSSFEAYLDAGQSGGTYCSKECLSEGFSDRADGGDLSYITDSTPGFGENHPNWKERIDRECIICEDVFRCKESSNVKTCSIGCRNDLIGERNTNRVLKNCEYSECYNLFSDTPKSNKMTCSPQCANDKRNDTKFKNGSFCLGKREYVDELEHIVRSSWEKELGLMLKDAGLDYSYESTSFRDDGIYYLPDFIMDDYIIEVKGIVRDKCVEKAKMCMRKTDKEYVVVGSELPSDKHFSWDCRGEVIDYVK